MTPRGIRNNNPGNIRIGRTIWKGESIEQFDPSFITFDGPEWGLRAIAHVLTHYQSIGLKSVRQMVNRWAPASENNTEAYIQAVARGVGVNPDEPVDLTVPGHMVNMIQAIVHHENGEQPYDTALIERAIGLA